MGLSKAGEGGKDATATDRGRSPAPVVAKDDLAGAVKNAIDLRDGQAAREWRHIVLHHSATKSGSLLSIDAEHRRRRDSEGRNWLGIGYHFVIGNGQGMADGEVQATFRWREQLAGAHAGDRTFNASGIGICLVGNFETQRPTRRQQTAMNELVSRLAEKFAIKPEGIVGHAEIKPTACPGKYLAVDRLRRRFSIQLNRTLSETTAKTGQRNGFPSFALGVSPIFTGP